MDGKRYSATTDVKDNNRMQKKHFYASCGMCFVWSNGSRESSKGVKLSYPLIRRNGSQFARPERWPIGIVEWALAGDRVFSESRFFENSKSEKLYRLCIEAITRYQFVMS
jgi:hypothetical protein